MNAFDLRGAGGDVRAAPRHFLELDQIAATDLRRIVDEAHRRKAARRGASKGAPDQDAPLDGHVLAMLFEKPSTRTRTSFDVAMRQLGGTTMVLNSADLQIGAAKRSATPRRCCRASPTC